MKHKLILNNAICCLSFLLGVGLAAAESEPETRSREAVESKSEEGNPGKSGPSNDAPKIEVCFVLDTTGSMSGLIEGAKLKIWSIANELVSAKPTPQLKLGLVGYRDRGDDYVVRKAALSDDIDAIYGELMKFEAGGGGDQPESVNEALRTAIRDMEWSEDSDVLKIAFLVGDAPPHMDYEQDVKYPELCKEAVKKGLIINTVQCGSIAETTNVWQEIARKSEGEYAALEQSGNMTALATPMDARLSELNSELGATMIAFGDETRRRQISEKQAAAIAAPASAGAERLKYNATTGKVVQGEGELIDSLRAGQLKLADVDAGQLPEELRGLDKAELEKEVQERAKKREEIQQEILRISKERDEYLALQRKEMSDGKDRDSFDEKVAETLREQAQRKGIAYE